MGDYNNIIKDILMIVFSGGFGSVLAHQLTKKKYTEEVKTDVINNEASAINIWRELTTELQSRVDKMDIELEKLRDEVLQLHKENIVLKKNNMDLERDIETLMNM